MNLDELHQLYRHLLGSEYQVFVDHVTKGTPVKPVSAMTGAEAWTAQQLRLKMTNDGVLNRTRDDETWTYSYALSGLPLSTYLEMDHDDHKHGKPGPWLFYVCGQSDDFHEWRPDFRLHNEGNDGTVWHSAPLDEDRVRDVLGWGCWWDHWQAPGVQLDPPTLLDAAEEHGLAAHVGEVKTILSFLEQRGLLKREVINHRSWWVLSFDEAEDFDLQFYLPRIDRTHPYDPWGDAGNYHVPSILSEVEAIDEDGNCVLHKALNLYRRMNIR